MFVCRRTRLRAGLVCSAAASALLLATPITAVPAYADGGTGGAACNGTVPGGTGGTGTGGASGSAGSTTTTCNTSTDASSGGGGGSAGGGAGGTGGTDGSGNTGGTGGSGGVNGNGAGTTTITNSAPLSGGNGGNGTDGAGSNNESGGGGGGAGGYGAIVTGSGTDSNSSTISGGNGGAGGAGQMTTLGNGGSGGNGGDGGVGIDFTGGSSTFTNTGTVKGGNGGGGGAGGFANGTSGAGGAGIVGSSLTIINSGTISGGAGGFANGSSGSGGVGITGSGLTIVNSGTISGGLSGDGSTRAAAIVFTGGTNTLEIDAGSSILGNVIAHSLSDTLALGGSNNSTFDVSAIGPTAQYQGFGVFVKTGSSTWTLTNTTTSVTSWQIQAGTLAISSDANLGAASGSVTLDGGTLQFLSALSSARLITVTGSNGALDTDGNNVTLSGTINGPGTLTKAGVGTLTLTGTDTYGGTVISGGTLQIGAGGTAGSITGNVTDNANLSFDLSSNYTFAGLISGSGNLLQAGTGTTILTNAETYTGSTTISAGTLQIGNGGTTGSLAGGTSGSIVPNITDNGTIAFDRSDAIVLNNVVSGTGGLTQLGSGTLTINGTETYLGVTNIANGTLIVDGSAADASKTIVESNATLGGSGTVSNLQVFAGGTVAPGPAGTTLSVTGTATFTPSSTYDVLLTPTSTDLVKVSGNASVAGTLDLAPAAGSYAYGTQFVVLTSANTTGNFQTVETTGSFGPNHVAEVSDDGKNIIVTIDAAQISPLLPAHVSANEKNVVEAIDFAMANDGAVPVFAPLALLSPSDLLKTLDAFTGEVTPGLQDAGRQAMVGFLDVLDSRAAFNGEIGAPQYASRYDFVQLADNDNPGGLYESPEKANRPLDLWVSFRGAHNRTQANPTLGTHLTQANDFGGTLGFGYHAPSGRGTFGIALGFDNLNWDLAQSLGKGHAYAYQGGMYASVLLDETYILGAASFGIYDATTDRNFNFQGMNAYHGKLTASSEGGHIEIGQNFLTVIGHVAPYLRAEAQDLHTPFFSESTTAGSPDFALDYQKEGHVDLTSEVGGAYNTNLVETADDIFRLKFRLGWLHDYSAGLKDTATFSGFTGATFTVHGASPAKDAAHAVVGVEQDFAAVAFTLDAEVILSSKTQSIGAANAGLSYRW